MTTNPLWTQIRQRGLSTLSVMGMSKNTGKTVALNHLSACAHADALTLGVSSIGRDGEERDQVFLIPKPPVLVWPGTLVATARDSLLRAKVGWKELAGTGIASPMGEIVIVRVLQHGEMEIAGASRSTDQQKVIAALKACGAALVFLDGALGRSQHASPAIAEGVILATGAALGGGIADVIRKTHERLTLLGIPPAEPALRVRCREVFEAGGVGIWDRAGAPLFRARIATLNAAATLLGFADREPATIALSGAVGKALWAAISTLAARQPGLAVVVADGTRLFIDAADLAGFRQRGGQLCADRPIQVVGLTLNPFSPLGGHFDAHELRAAARQAFPEVEVADVRLDSATPAPGALA